MKRHVLMIGLALLAVGATLAILARSQARLESQAQSLTRSGRGQRMQFKGYTISGPYTHENLAVFLIHGQDQLTGKTPLTLQEAMAQKKVIVHETQNVSELAIENVSDEEVYVQSGEIVKGGQQDRTLAYDLLVPPRSGRLPLASFCVEQGRWNQRGNEAVAAFSASTGQLHSKGLKLAAKRSRSQREVWANVTAAQEKLSRNVEGYAPAASISATSLQLTLENEQVQGSAKAYLGQLSPIIEGKGDVIGYAFAINGQINSADLYSSHALFQKLWPKLLEASAVEAVAELQKGKEFKPAAIEAVRACLAEAEQGEPSEREVTKRVKLVTFEAEKSVLFETRDQQRAGVWIHRNYLTK